MNQNPNINKYFNRTPKGFLIALMVFYGGIGVLLAIGSLFGAGSGFFERIGSFIMALIWTVVVTGVVFFFYMRLVTLEKVRLGKHLNKYYGLEGDALKEQIAKIDAEVGKPLYADAADKKRYNAFFVTENWLVGTDGIMLMRANACKRADITKIEPAVLTRYRKGITYYYYILQVTDKNNYTYQFWLRSQENVDMAYSFLMNGKEEAV